MAAPRSLGHGDVLEMRAAAAAGISSAALARKFRVGNTTAERIVRGHTYRDVGGPTIAAAPRPDRLPAATVIEIRTRRASGEEVSALAAHYGLTRQTCDRIVRGVTYEDVGGPRTADSTPPGSVTRQTLLACALLERRGGPFEIWEVAELMNVDSPTASGRVSRLRDLEYVARCRFDPLMSRLTPDGWAHARQIVAENLNRNEE
jgi:hypothetical protein